MKLIVGLTGGIGTGKSTVGRFLQSAGAALIDADLLVKELVTPGQPALPEIARLFGDSIVSPDGSLDREILGRLVFEDPSKRLALEQILHPQTAELILQRIGEAKKTKTPLIVVDVPLLFESNWQEYFDGVLLVYAPVALQKVRLKERNQFSADQIAKRLEAQWPIEQKKPLATWIIDNSQSLKNTQEQVQNWWHSVVDTASKL